MPLKSFVTKTTFTCSFALALVLSPLCALCEEKAPPAGIDQSWYQKATKQIEAEEYWASLQEKDFSGKPFKSAKWHFTNRAQGLRAYVSSGDGY